MLSSSPFVVASIGLKGASPLVQEQQGPEGRRAVERRVCCLEGLLQGLDSLSRTANGLVGGRFYAVTRS